jgi:hypothetical protein
MKYLIAIVLLALTCAAHAEPGREDLYGNPIESWRCKGGIIFNVNKHASDTAAETMRRFNLSRDYTVRLLNEAIARCDGQDIRNWNRRMRSPERR